MQLLGNKLNEIWTKSGITYNPVTSMKNEVEPIVKISKGKSHDFWEDLT